MLFSDSDGAWDRATALREPSAVDAFGLLLDHTGVWLFARGRADTKVWTATSPWAKYLDGSRFRWDSAITLTLGVSSTPFNPAAAAPFTLTARLALGIDTSTRIHTNPELTIHVVSFSRNGQPIAPTTTSEAFVDHPSSIDDARTLETAVGETRALAIAFAPWPNTHWPLGLRGVSRSFVGDVYPFLGSGTYRLAVADDYRRRTTSGGPVARGPVESNELVFTIPCGSS